MADNVGPVALPGTAVRARRSARVAPARFREAFTVDVAGGEVVAGMQNESPTSVTR